MQQLSHRGGAALHGVKRWPLTQSSSIRVVVQCMSGAREDVVKPERVLELFSGMGGFRFALNRVFPGDAIQVSAVDINTNANRLYQASFGEAPQPKNIDQLSPSQLDKFNAELWCLSPPCQPFTTTNNARRRDDTDPRSKAIIHLLQTLPMLARPPRWLIMENVEGFWGSRTHALFLTSLSEAGYSLQEFVVSPHQLGVPYSRPRYYALATMTSRVIQPGKRTLFSQQPEPLQPSPALSTSQLHTHPPSLPLSAVQLIMGTRFEKLLHSQAASGLQGEGLPTVDSAVERLASRQGALLPPISPPGMGAPHEPPSGGAFWPPSSPPGSSALSSYSADCLPVGLFLQEASIKAGDMESNRFWERYAVPQGMLSKYFRMFDIITGSSRHCNCITKNYSKQALGAGSVVASPPLAQHPECITDNRGRTFFEADPSHLLFLDRDANNVRGGQHGLRFLSPTEVANLHGVPLEAIAPALHSPTSMPLLTDRQMWQALGNSLSIDITAWLVWHLLSGGE